MVDIKKPDMFLHIVYSGWRREVGSLSIQDLIAWDEASGKTAGKNKIVNDKESRLLKELAKETYSEIKHASDCSEISKG